MRGFFKKEDGQTLVLYALFLAVLLGMAALAIDVGYLYVVRTSLQRAADSGAFAGASGLVVSEGEARSRATDFAGKNLSGNLSGSATTVTFPTATSIQVTIMNPAIRLFFGGVIGRPTAAVSASASASVEPVASVTGDVVPLAIYCNNPQGCTGVLSVGQTQTARRYCGNFFDGGANGSACGNIVAPGEVFLQGVTFTGSSNSNAVFRSEVYDGFSGTVTLRDVVGALPGNRNGWRDGMENRLAEGRNEMTFIGVRAIGDGRQLEVFDFIKVRVLGFQREGNTERTTFQIIQVVSSTTLFGTAGQGYGVNSVYGVRLTE